MVPRSAAFVDIALTTSPLRRGKYAARCDSGRRDTPRAMPEESTTPDLVELTRRLDEAANRLDFDAVVSFYAPDAVWEGRASGMTFEGRTAIRGFWEDWFASYEELWLEQEEDLALGNGVVFAVIMQMARLAGSSGYVRYRHALLAGGAER